MNGNKRAKEFSSTLTDVVSTSFDAAVKVEQAPTVNAKYTIDDQDDKEDNVIMHMNRKSFRKGTFSSVSSFTDFA